MQRAGRPLHLKDSRGVTCLRRPPRWHERAAEVLASDVPDTADQAFSRERSGR